MTAPAKIQPPTATELALKAMGLGEVIAAARELANAGTVARIIAFANAAESLAAETRGLGDRLDRLEAKLNALLGLETFGAGPEPGSGSPHGGPGGGADARPPGEPRAA
jgi:hypothetical protein